MLIMAMVAADKKITSRGKGVSVGGRGGGHDRVTCHGHEKKKFTPHRSAAFGRL